MKLFFHCLLERSGAFNMRLRLFGFSSWALISQTKEGLDRIDDFITAIPNTYQFLELNMNHIAPVKKKV